MEMKKWEVVLLSEIRSEEDGIIWFGEGESLTEAIHSKKAAAILRGAALTKWCEEKKRRIHGTRTTSIKIGNYNFISVYQSVWRRNNPEEMDSYRSEVERDIMTSLEKEKIIIGGDHSSHIGRGPEREGIRGRFGFSTGTNEAREDLLNWCELQGLAHLISYSSHSKRGTWYSNICRRWYELEGYLMKKQQRHCTARKNHHRGSRRLSNRRQVILTINCKEARKCMNDNTKKPEINWEKLNKEKTAARYKEATEERIRQRRTEITEEFTNWKVMAEVMTEVARETCGNRTRRVANPWTRGREDDLVILSGDISRLLERREWLNQGRATKARRHKQQEERRNIRDKLKWAKKRLKNSLKEWEREWWELIMTECQEAQDRGDIGVMYRSLQKIGQKENKTT